MAHVLVYVDDSMMCPMLGDFCESEGHTVTATQTLDDALMVLRTSLHRVVAVMEWNHAWRHPYHDFFALRDANPEWYAQHGYIGIRWWTLSEEEQAVLAAAGVRILFSPFDFGDLIRAIEELAAGPA